MAFGPKICACCGALDGIECHHLYLKADGCPDDLTVWLCFECHGRTHGLRRVNLSIHIKAAVVRRRRKLTRAQLSEAACRYAGGETMVELAKSYGVTEHTIWMALGKALIRILDRAER